MAVLILTVGTQCEARLARIAERNGLTNVCALEMLLWEADASQRTFKPFALPAQLPAHAGQPLPSDEPLLRVKAEAYEYRIYDLEVAYMMQLSGTPESEAAKASMEKVTAYYHRDYPGRPLNPKPRPTETPIVNGPFGPPAAEKKPRKPYTKRIKTAA